MTFHNKQKDLQPPCLVFDNDRIKSVNCFKYLGIIFGKELTFKEHINQISCDIARSIGCHHAIKKYVSKQILRHIYMGFIQTKICYGILVGMLVWGHMASRL